MSYYPPPIDGVELRNWINKVAIGCGVIMVAVVAVGVVVVLVRCGG